MMTTTPARAASNGVELKRLEMVRDDEFSSEDPHVAPSLKLVTTVYPNLVCAELNLGEMREIQACELSYTLV